MAIDPDCRAIEIARQVTILEWVEGLYEKKVDREDTKIESTLFDNLDLSVDRVLQAR